MNKFLNKYKANDYVLLFSAGAAVGHFFMGSKYIFPEGEIVGEEEYLRIFLKFSNIYFMF